MSQVFIQENFFPTELHKEIVQLMINTEYEPPAKEKREMHKGAYWHQHVLPNNCDVQIEIKILNKTMTTLFSYHIHLGTNTWSFRL